MKYKIQLLLFIFTYSSFTVFSQSTTFKEKFSQQFKYNLTPIANTNFKEYYELYIPQAINHNNPDNTFNQRICIGFQNFDAPTIIVTDGYAIEYAFNNNYTNELAKELNANVIVVEHRYFGKSVPQNTDWTYLTVKQAAQDYHYIKSLLDTLFTNKWISTGISKGGQAALAYKMYYPDDVVATIVYGTAIKNKASVTSDTILHNLMQSPCGMKLSTFQLHTFKNKKALIPLFDEFCIQKNFHFSPLDNEIVLDYLLLELPFSFWQNGFSCNEIPDTSATKKDIINYIVKVVPPRFFSSKNKAQLHPAFYMFYYELGYYEYNLQPFKNYLKQTAYPNNYFAPENIQLKFDNTYQTALFKFMQSKSAENIFFIYGENDPWALQSNATKNIYTIKNGSHKSRIADLEKNLQMELYTKLNYLLNKTN